MTAPYYQDDHVTLVLVEQDEAHCEVIANRLDVEMLPFGDIA